MQSINAWAGIICICSVIACMIEMISSDTKFEKTVRFVIGSFMLYAVLSPAVQTCSIILENDISAESSFPLEETEIEKYRKELIDERLGKLLEEKLNENDIEPEKTDVNFTYDDEEKSGKIECSIVISEKQKSSIPKINRIIKENFGVQPKIFIL